MVLGTELGDEQGSHADDMEQEEQEMLVEDGAAGEGGLQPRSVEALQACGNSDLGSEDMQEWDDCVQRQKSEEVGGLGQLEVTTESVEGGSDSETSI